CDETHAAHVGGKVVNNRCVAHCLFASGFLEQIKLSVFRVGKHLEPLLDRLHVDRANVPALAEQVRHEMSADKTARAANYDRPRSHETMRGLLWPICLVTASSSFV